MRAPSFLRFAPYAFLVAALAAPEACTLTSQPDGVTKVETAVPLTIDRPAIPTDVEVTLQAAGEAHGELCAPDDAHPHFPDDADMITRSFCQDLKPGGVMPTPRSLDDLLQQLGLAFVDKNGGNGVGGNPAFAFLAHSSALTARKITTLTPTVFVFTPPPADGSAPTGQFSLLGFDPGEQFVEVAANDPTAGVVNFYVVFFDQACNSAPGGCTNADLLSQKLVTGWSNVRVYEMSTSLGNTIFDCHVCHKPDDGAKPFLRMQEIEPPFTHWMSTGTDGGRALLADFHAAHGTQEDYGPIPAAMIDKGDPAKLAAFINQAGMTQPNVFPSATIESQVKKSAAAQPAVNVPAGTSGAWQVLYDYAASGAFIAAPYHDVKVTDPTKLAAATTAYQRFLGGQTTDLPDIRDIFLDTGLRDMGFAPKLGLDGRGLLRQMCQECHNSRLDRTISRENFLVDELDQMSTAEKQLAIQRMQLSEGTRLHMPPPLFRTVTALEIELMTVELQR